MNSASRSGKASSNAKLLIVDDDPAIRKMLTNYFDHQGYTTASASTAQEMRAVLAREPIDLVILDVVMPEEDGLSAIGALRADLSVPVIMVTGKSDTVDRIVGLELGADDYVAKPFELRELLARVRSVLRRTRATRAESAPEKSSSFEFGGFRLDVESQSLFTADGVRLHLTLAEFQLLHAFVRHPNRVLTRDQLLAASARRGWEPFDRSIDVHISHLRRKIEERPDRPQYIRTIRGAGYMFCPTPGREPPDSL